MSKLTLTRYLAPGTEAIAYQNGSKLFTGLTQCLSTFISEGRWTESALKATGIETLIFEETGLRVNLKLDKGLVNAYVQPILIDPNGPFIQPWNRMGFGDLIAREVTTIRAIEKYANTLRGEIDLERGHVSGVFSKLDMDACLGTGLWSECKLPAEEVAAILLHELGHAFTFFENLTRTMTENMILATAVSGLNRMEVSTERLELVRAVSASLNVQFDDAIAASTLHGPAFATLVIKKKVDQIRSATGSDTYDLRSAEFAADQWATRQGAGRYLVQALDRIYALYGNAHRLSLGMNITRDVACTAVAVLLMLVPPMAIFIGTLTFIYFTVADVEAKIYHDPLERVQSVRKDLIQSLKQSDLTPASRQAILNDLAAIDNISKGMLDYRSWMNWVYIYLTAGRRKQYNDMRFQQELEKLADNDLFIRAATLQTLA